MLRERVLLLEDDLEDGFALTRGLSPQGYQLETVQSIEEVEEAARDGVQKFICDIRLGDAQDRSGLRAIKRIRNHNPSAFIVVCSAIAPAWESLALELGADVVVTKGRGGMRTTVFEIANQFLRHDGSRRIFRFTAGWAVLPLMIGAGGSWGCWKSGLSAPFLTAVGAIFWPLALAALFVLTVSIQKGKRDPAISRRPVFNKLRALRVFLLLALASGVVYDIIKKLFGI